MAKKPTDSTILYRSETNKVVGGVCGGLGEVFGFDPTIIRIIFAAAVIFGGSGVLLYIILWIVIPSESKVSHSSKENLHENIEEMKDRMHDFSKDFRKHPDNSRMLFGGILLIIGVMFLLSNFGFSTFFNMDKFWPLILVALGFLILSRRHERNSK